MSADRRLAWDWYPGTVPVNVRIADTAYVETTFSFFLFKSEREDAITIGDGASTYLGTMFDVGRDGRVSLGDYALVHGARIICDAEVVIDAYALISWNVVLMDSYRVPADPDERRGALLAAAVTRRLEAAVPARPIHVGRGAWIGFDSCILPGVSIGEGSIIGARSVVRDDVEPFSIVAGNPARLVRRLTVAEINDGR